MAPAQRAPMWMRSSTNHSLVSSSARPTPPRTAAGRDAGVLEHELRVAVGERVHVVGVVLDADARDVVVDEEQRRQQPVAVHDVGVEDHEVRVVRAGHEPLLAVEDVLAGRGVADRGRPQRARVRAGAVLGDRVAPRALAAHRRVEVARPLLGVAMDQGVVRPRDVRPQAARALPELLVDQHLLERRPALPAERHRERAAVEPGLDRGLADRGAPVARDAAVRRLELGLARLEDLADERAGPRLELELRRGQGEVHRREGCATPPGSRRTRRGARDAAPRAAPRRRRAGGRDPLRRAGRAP